MAPEEETVPDEVPIRIRRQKHSRACELCRKRKVLCDASDKPDHRCTRCTTMNLECQFTPVVMKPKRPTNSYVDVLETRLRKMEELLERLSDNQVADIINDSDEHISDSGPAISQPSPPRSVAASLRPPALDFGTHRDLDEDNPSEDEAVVSLGHSTGYHGKSSTKSMIVTVIELKSQGASPDHEPPPWYRPTCISTPFEPKPFKIPFVIEQETRPFTNFPPPDILDRLVNAYFENLNVFMPLIHRPTFENDIKDGLHLRDRRFGALVLLVCANGYVWDDEPRPEHEPTFIKNIGVDLVEPLFAERWSVFARPSLHEMQMLCLMSAWLISTDAPQGPWVLLSLGIRLALDVGAHRRKMYGAKATVEGELWKRAFWWLINLDRAASFALGRPCAIQDEDFDLDPLVECDDEYWIMDGPYVTFQQPAGVPSKVAFANAYSRLIKILAFASRTLYTINRSKLLFGFVGAEWKHEIVAELDSALNRWMDKVPSHLRWDPNREDRTFFIQSACLYAVYYQVQICVHRQFLPSLRSPPPPNLAFPSLMICTSASRSCLNVLEVYCKRIKRINWIFSSMQMPLFFVGLVLLINLWGGKPSEREAKVLMKDVERCVALVDELAACGSHAARKIGAILQALISWQPKPLSRGSAPSSSSQSKSKARSASPLAGTSELGDLLSDALSNLAISLNKPNEPAGRTVLNIIRMSQWKDGVPPFLLGSTVSPDGASVGAGESREEDAVRRCVGAQAQSGGVSGMPWVRARQEDVDQAEAAPAAAAQASPSDMSQGQLHSSHASTTMFGSDRSSAPEFTSVPGPTGEAQGVAGEFAMMGYGDDYLACLEGMLPNYFEPFPTGTQMASTNMDTSTGSGSGMAMSMNPDMGAGMGAAMDIGMGMATSMGGDPASGPDFTTWGSSSRAAGRGYVHGQQPQNYNQQPEVGMSYSVPSSSVPPGNLGWIDWDTYFRSSNVQSGFGS